MKALVYEGPKTMVMRDVPVPEINEDEVLIRVERAGICGSELSGYLGQNSLRKPPLIMGHEFAGVVEKVGKNVETLNVGDRVTANPLVTCFDCYYCRNGQQQICQARRLIGAHRPGAFAEYVAVPYRNVFRLEDHVSFEEGTLVEPFAFTVHTCRLLELQPQERLLIYGAGPIGLLALQTAQIYGVRDIVVVDLNEERLEIVEELGGIAKTNIDVESERFDVAIDAVGAGITRLNSVKAVRPGGKVAFTGLHEAESTLPINDMIRSEIRTIGVFGYSDDDFLTAVRWIGEERITMTPWIENTPLSDGGRAFEKLITNPGKVAKIVLNI